MTRIGRGPGRCGGLALTAAGALWLAGAGQPASAGDDGQAPIWASIGSMFKFVGGGGDEEPRIDYRDHPRLVLPQKMELPEPAKAASAGVTDWPRDQEVVAEKKKKQEDGTPNNARVPLRRWSPTIAPGDTVTSPSTAGMGPSQKCKAGPGQTCDEGQKKPQMNWNPLTWVGIEKKPQTVLGPEPERESLTDPPLGYRAPTEGAGVKVDTN